MGLAPMTEAMRVEAARRTFAKVTGALEDAAIVAADGQASPNLSAARQACDRLITLLEATIAQLQRLRKLG